MELAEIRELDQPGYTRRLFSQPYQRSRAWVEEQMMAAGLEVRRDPIGNLIGELRGEAPELPQIAIGSHTDTVAGGGRFDGMVGVMAAIEVARVIGEGPAPLRHPLLVADFLGEEPNRFGLSCLGSRAVTGGLSPSHLRLEDDEGRTLASALTDAGYRPDDLQRGLWRADRLHCYLELHIEQGSRLQRAGIRLGVVTSIAGIHRALVTLTGRPDHAGTTAMDERRDALAAAAEVVLMVERVARRAGARGSGVGTVGRLEVLPGATNVVPGQARIWTELRSSEPAWLTDRRRALELEAKEMCARRQIQLEIEWLSAEDPVTCAPGARRVIRDALDELGVAHLELDSGASHDAAHLARVCPAGMIFIPSLDGRSHCPEEWSDPEDVTLGAAALLSAVLTMDRSESV